jgi:acetyltransferase-like isoleucine patch superfamily enzyme
MESPAGRFSSAALSEYTSMPGLYRYLATSDSGIARTLRAVRRSVNNFSLPAPRIITRPVLGMIIGLQALYHFLYRVFVCEPLFKARCKSYGRNFHTGARFHWVSGQGEIVIGDNVLIDGLCDFLFAARYSPRPALTIGDNTGIGHGCSFTVGDSITIGKQCRIAGYVQMFDVAGHPSDPEARLAGKPADLSEVRPIVIGDNVWIGARAVVYPGVSIGDNSIVALGSVVMTNIPPNVVVAGNPARQIRTLAPKAAPEDSILKSSPKPQL